MQNDHEVKEIFKIALKLRVSTPYSFRIFSDHLGIFSFKKFDRLKYLNQYFQPEKMISLPIFASEVFYITFKYLVKCPDETCNNFQNSMESLNMKTESVHLETNEVVEFHEATEQNLEISTSLLKLRVQLLLL